MQLRSEWPSSHKEHPSCSYGYGSRFGFGFKVWDYGYGHLLVWVVVVVVAGVVVTAFKGWSRISVSVCGVERGQR